MASSYWRDNKSIESTHKEKIDTLNYEVWMFRETCDALVGIVASNTKTQFEKNLLIESLAIHSRVLIDFFYADKKFINDLIAQDFLPKNIIWRNIRPPLTEMLKVAKNKADKQLAHMSNWRVKIEKDWKKSWNISLIKRDMEILIKLFNSVLHKSMKGKLDH